MACSFKWFGQERKRAASAGKEDGNEKKHLFLPAASNSTITNNAPRPALPSSQIA